MNRFFKLFLLFLAASTLPACYPQRISRDCRAKMNECLAHCAPGEQGNEGLTERAMLFSVDQRTRCERQCHDLCAGSPVPRSSPAQPAPDPANVLGPEAENDPAQKAGTGP